MGRRHCRNILFLLLVLAFVYFCFRCPSISKFNGCSRCQMLLVGYNKPMDFSCGTQIVFLCLYIRGRKRWIGIAFFFGRDENNFLASVCSGIRQTGRLGDVSGVFCTILDLNVMLSRRLYDNQIIFWHYRREDTNWIIYCPKDYTVHYWNEINIVFFPF